METINNYLKNATEPKIKAIAWRYAEEEEKAMAEEEVKQTLKERASRIIRDFKWLSHYDGIVNWFTRNHGRGLLVRGTIGCGKTIIIRDIIIPAIREAYGLHIDCYNSMLEATKALDNHLLGNPLRGAAKTIYIDDVGREGLFKKYGNERNVFEEIVEDCYTYRKLLMVTTNLTKSSMAEKYDARTISRLKEMMTDVTIVAKDMRI